MNDISKYTGEGVGLEGNPNQGPFIEFTIQVNEGVIHDAVFRTYKCGVAVRICKILCELIKDKNIRDSMCISTNMLIKKSGRVPLGKRFCLNMAISALQKAISSIVCQIKV